MNVIHNLVQATTWRFIFNNSKTIITNRNKSKKQLLEISHNKKRNLSLMEENQVKGGDL